MEKRKRGRPRCPDGPRERVTVTLRQTTYANLEALRVRENRKSLSDMARVLIEEQIDGKEG
jgi:hypothetical protein